MRIRTVPLGVYIPGTSPLHRLPPSIKLASVLAFSILSTLLARTPVQAGLCVVGAAVLFAIARIPLRIAWGQIWPPIPFLLFLGAFQWWQFHWQKAATIVLVILAAIMVAVLMTLTTTVAEMMDSLERALRPLQRFGVPADNISLAISLAIRLIPVQLATVYEVLDARRARGADFSLTAFGTPVMIRSIRRARAIGDALIARGVGD